VDGRAGGDRSAWSACRHGGGSARCAVICRGARCRRQARSLPSAGRGWRGGGWTGRLPAPPEPRLPPRRSVRERPRHRFASCLCDVGSRPSTWTRRASRSSTCTAAPYVILDKDWRIAAPVRQADCAGPRRRGRAYHCFRRPTSSGWSGTPSVPSLGPRPRRRSRHRSGSNRARRRVRPASPVAIDCLRPR